MCCEKSSRTFKIVITAPGQVWSWDITKLKGPVKKTCSYLHIILDIFNRWMDAWMISNHEKAVYQNS